MHFQIQHQAVITEDVNIYPSKKNMEKTTMILVWHVLVVRFLTKIIHI